MASIVNDDDVGSPKASPTRKEKKKNRRKKDKQKNIKDDEVDSNNSSSKNKKLTFKEKQELRQKKQKDRRQAKQRCYLCGEAGHTRKQCPGIEDGGRGESRYRAKGKGSKMSSFNKKKNRGEKKNKKRGGSFDIDESDMSREEDLYSLKIFQSKIPYIDACTNISGLLNRRSKKTIVEACKTKLPTNLSIIVSSLNKVSELQKTYPVGVISSGDNENNNEDACVKKVFYTSGIHPYYADEFQFEHIRESLIDSFKRSDVIAVGPVGLDYSTRCSVEPSTQKEIFTEQVKIAVKMGKPLIVHVRPELRYEEGHKRALKDVATILSMECPTDYKICLNAYAGTNDTLVKLMKLFTNLYVSFSSIITFSKAKHIREVAFDM